MKIFQKSTAFFLTALISAGVTFTGCAFPGIGSARLYHFVKEHISESTADPRAQEAFDQFTEELFFNNVSSSVLDLHYTVTDPQSMGIEPAEELYGDPSLPSLERDTEELRGYAERLDAIDRSRLSPQSRLDYDILQQYFETELTCAGLEIYVQPLAPTIGVQAQLPVLLAEYSFYRPEDIEDYFSLLSGLDEYFGKILSLEREKAAQGLMMDDAAIDRVLDSCRPYLETGENALLAGTFAERLRAMEALDGNSALSEEQKAAYEQRHRELIARAFVPAYQRLMDGLEALKGTGRIKGGLCNYPKGKEYYRYLVYSSTFTSCKTVDTLKKTIEKRIDDDFEAVRKLITDDPLLYDQMEQFSFSMTDPEEIISCLQENIRQDYPEPITKDYSLHYVPKALEPVLSPAFYLTPPMDCPELNTIYINGGSYAAQDELFTTLAHEGYPGHLYQSAYFIQTNPKPFRHLLSFSSYKEGWATYVEFDSCRLDNAVSPELARLWALDSSINLGIHAYLDIMVNDQGWGLEQVSRYVNQYFNDPDQQLAQALLETMCDNPSNYLEYYVGYLEFSDMRQRAEKALGSAFEAKAFHQFILDIGPAPFPVIRERLEEWIKEQKQK